VTLHLQAKSDKVQSFSKFQAELRAQQRQSKSGHKHKHDRKDKRHKPDTPKALPQSTDSVADNAQVNCSTP